MHKKAFAISKFIIVDVFKGNKLLSTCFVKPLEILTERTRNTIGQCIGWLLFDMLISFNLKKQSISVKKLTCKNIRLLAEAKCHAVWNMIVPFHPYNYHFLSYNDNRILVCVEHGFIINKTYTSIKKTVHKNCKCPL